MAGLTCADCTTVYAVGATQCPQCGSTEHTDQPGGTVLPSVTVVCGNAVCRYEGRERRVHLRTAAPGVVEVPRLACAGCGLDMPTVTPWPPVTDSEDTEVPKITVHGGASNEGAEPEPGAVEETGDAEGGEDVSAGTSSSTSSEREPTSPEPSEKPGPSRARTTASRSKKGPTGSSSADSTDGGQETGTSETGSADK
ncbi:hypothetical protein [Streptomyces griseorubiginosus]|uniref:hypothetical protein n=1 Tax=Streptomyces griseorubiginosus TaxID=67304 RepID=UPI0036EBACC6